MKVTYQTLHLELPYPVVEIVDVTRQEGLNQHACLSVTAVIEDKDAEDYLYQAVESQQIKVGFGEAGKSVFFTGQIESVAVFYDKGQAMLQLKAVSATKKWDIVKKQRSFQNQDATYGDVINQVLADYDKAFWISKTETNRPVPGLLLQYDETDWEFLCRLASHFATYVMADPSREIGQIFFGLPELNNGRRIEGNNYAISQDMIRYQTYTNNTSEELMIQNNLGWDITGTGSYQLGEQVLWRQVACQVTGILMETKGSQILYTCHLERTEGVRSRYYGNQNISGLSLPAFIKERKGNCLRVHFSLDPEYRSGNNIYYTFAIETTSWYCLPEEGSLVHIYFQNCDEASAIAIHALRMSGGSGASKSVSAQGAVGDKSFSTSDGKAMKFTETGIMFVSDESAASTITLAKEGSLNVDGQTIILNSPVQMEIGKATIAAGEGETEVIARNLSIECKEGPVAIGILSLGEEEVTLAVDKGIVLGEKGEVSLIASNTLFYDGEQKDPPGVQYSDAKLKEEDKAQRDDHNQEVFEVREREAKSKFTVGAVIAGAGLILVAGAVTVLSGGFAAPAAAALVAGSIGGLCGAAQMDEASLDMAKMESGDFSQSYNAIRDGVFGGNQATYNMVMYGSIMIGASLLLAPLGAKLSLVARGIMQAAVSGTLSAGTMFLQDVTDGYIDAGWQDYALTFRQSAAIAGFGFVMGVAAAAAGRNLKIVNDVLKSAGKYTPALIIGAETLIDVGVDYASSQIFGTDFDLGMSVLTNLASNIAFSIDPVDMATGGFCLAATDLSLPDLWDDRFRIQRFYNSLVPCKGSMGKQWIFCLDSRLFLQDEEQKVDVVCVDGHTERFAMEDGAYQNQRQGDLRYQLHKLPEEEGFVLLYAPEQKRYYYDSMGRLLSIGGRGKGSLTVQYQEAHISRVTTSAGYVLDFLYEEDRIVEIRDELGRSVRYKYENGYLKAVCHVDEGVTTYHYDAKHRITQVIDQNGHAYVTNDYDEKGRVAVQHYLDGTRSTLEYHPEIRENTVYIEALGRTERYCYNKEHLVTHNYYDDGTGSEIGYDEWTNRIYEKDRNGNVTRRRYSVFGTVLGEELPSGQVWEYEYDGNQNLVSKKADTGEEYRYGYDTAGLLVEEQVKVKKGTWKRKSYERDTYGRILKETDSQGNTACYAYQMKEGHILTEPSQMMDALGQRTLYEYDRAGRNVSVTTESGTVELGYNRQNYVSYVRDAKGNETRRIYDRMGNLTALFPPNQGAGGHAWMYRYDFFDRLTEVRDPLGDIWKKERNLAGDITREIHPCGYAEVGEEGYGIHYEYDTDSRRIRTIYPDGSVERCFYDGNGNLVKKVRPAYYDEGTDDGRGIAYQYDAMNRLKQIKDEDGVIRSAFLYDKSGNLVEEKAAGGYSTYYAYDLLGNCVAAWVPVEKAEGEILYRITLFEYDTESNKIKESRGLDKVFRGGYSLRYHELSFTYDGLNRLTSVKDAYGAKASYRYNCLNQKVYESFWLSKDVKKTVCYEYDAAGNMTEKREGIEERFLKHRGSGKVIWAVTRYEYDANGNCIRTVSPKGYRKEFCYDMLDRVIREEELDRQGGIRRRYRYQYDAAGNLLERVDESLEGSPYSRKYRYDKKDRLTHLADESGATTRVFYDKNDRIEKVVRPEQFRAEEDDGAGMVYGYNCRDQVLAVTGPDGMPVQTNVYSAAGNLHAVRKGKRQYTEYAYNLAGQPLAVYLGEKKARDREAAQSFAYDAWGNITGVVDGNRNQTGFVLDDWGRITEVHTPEGGVERYTYDYAGNIISTTDANGGTIRYRYNSFGQVSEIVDQEGDSEFFYYDEEGRPEIHIDRNGNTVRTHYNMDNRLLYRRAEDAKGRNAITNQYVYYSDGRLKEAVGGGVTYQYDYTANGQLRSKSSSGKSLLEYAYDRNGNITELKDLTGAVTRYTYDSMNRLLRTGDAKDDKLLAAYSYTPGGQLQSLSYGNGARTEYTYQDDGQMESLVMMTSDGRVILNYAYAYDGNGNCTRKSGDRDRNEYAYDRMNRLTEAVYNGEKEQFSYDLAGNRLKKASGNQEETYYYNVKNQLVRLEKETGPVCYTYDQQGNMTSEEGSTESHRYGYDAMNRQDRVIIGGATLRYQYDGENLRYETEENGTIIRYLFDRGELAAETAGVKQKSYRRGYRIVSQEEQGNVHYHLQDEMQSTVFILDEEQNIKKSYRYDAFGGIIEEGGSLENRITYTGQMYDGVTGQYYLRARFYNPKIGRFLQEDVYRGDGLNLYAYCCNNPVIYFDPTGYFGLCPRGKNAPNYSKEKPLDDPRLKSIYDKWIADGISEEIALDYLTKYGGRPDVEYLIDIDRFTDQAYQAVLNDFKSNGNSIFSTAAQKALENHPWLGKMFLGTAIDKEFKYLVRSSNLNNVYEITLQGLPGADLYFKSDSNYWVDITTSGAADKHFNKYKSNGYVAAYR